MDANTQQIVVGFRTPEALAKGESVLRNYTAAQYTTESPAALDQVPQQRRPDSQSGLPYAAALGGLAGAMIGAFISVLTTQLPNLPTVEGSTTELFVLVPLGGAVLGAIASSLLSLLSGANPEEPDFAYYKLIMTPASGEEAQKVTEALLAENGRLLPEDQRLL
ncbi:MAG: hypothetical protein DCF25_03530 [Leptolyngbya foveolarum]|uniref:Uncharacterized protein n=1 Tax=Leptolyngbya foveolarum TaxID=47253 RepID=A0A2W4UNZ0_9CYAN|nr:MAG: hypothetical protein DCF25_03530 [Leptolyngbya foveolarum]